MTPDALHTQPGAGVFAMWRARAEYHVWPRAGGWADQPLDLLVQLSALDLVEATWRIWRSDNQKAISKFTALQIDLVKWLEASQDE